MNKLLFSIVCFLILIGTSNAQDFKILNYNHESLFFHKYIISGGLQIAEKAVLYRNKIMQKDEILFCMIDFKSKEMILLTEKDYDDTIIKERMKKNGYNLTKKSVEPFNAHDFLDYYVRADHLSRGYVSDVKPRMLNTGNSLKDAKNYAVAKKEWINEFPYAYQKMITPQQVTKENLKEIELKSE